MMKRILLLLFVLIHSQTLYGDVCLGRRIDEGSCKHINPNKYLGKIGVGKMIVDVDTGSDDAVALLFALLSGQREVIAVTTVSGNTNRIQTSKNTQRTLGMIKSKIPIYPGCSEPISEFRKSDNFFGKDGLGDSPVPQPEESREIEKENAVPFLLRMVKEFPGEITIVALGPLTNIAMAIKMDPLFLDLVKVVVWSGGSVEGVGNVEPGLEFNSYFDPMATHIVFNKTKCPVVVVPWELIVFYAKTTVDWRENVLGSVETKLVDYINAIENYSIKHSGTWVAADVKTMFVALFPQFVTKSEFIHMEGIYEGGHTKGLLLLDYARSNGKYCNALVIRGLNVEQFQNKLLQAFTLREDVSKNSRVQMPEYRFALVK